MAEETDETLGRLLSGGAVLFVGMALQLALGFLTRVLVGRLLGSVDYGEVALGLALVNMAAIVAVLGTDTGVGRFLPRYEDPGRRRGLLLSAFQTAIPLSVAVAALVVWLAGPLASSVFHDPSVAPIVRAFGLAIPFAAFVRLGVGSVRGMQDSLPRVYIQYVGLPVSRFLLVGAGLLVGFRSVGIAWAYAAAYAVAAAIALGYLYRRTPLFDDVEPKYVRTDLLAFSAPVLITQTMNVTFHNFDTVMLASFATTGDVGVYNAVYPLAKLLSVTLVAFGFLFMPTVSELDADSDGARMKRTYQVVSKWLFLATLPLFLVLVTYPGAVIRHTFGPEYVAGGATLAVLAVGFFSHVVAGPSGDTLTALGRTRTIMADNVAVVCVNVALNLYLIPRYGFLGAALATTVGFVLLNGLYLAQLYHATGIHPFRPSLFAPAAVAVVVWAALAFGAQHLGGSAQSLLALGGHLTVFALSYPVVVLWFGGVEPEERRLLERLDGRTGVDLRPVCRLARRFEE